VPVQRVRAGDHWQTQAASGRIGGPGICAQPELIVTCILAKMLGSSCAAAFGVFMHTLRYTGWIAAAELAFNVLLRVSCTGRSAAVLCFTGRVRALPLAVKVVDQ
jgi:hypothetical protein